MGRYWNSNSHEGKFGFAVQPSDDPEIFGMESQEPCVIDYYLGGDAENIAEAEKVLDKQYDILGVAKKDRIYEYTSEYYYEEISAILKKYHKKNWHRYNEAEDGKIIPYADEEWQEGAVPNNRDVALAENRLDLGLAILTELKKDGYCSLTAEL